MEGEFELASVLTLHLLEPGKDLLLVMLQFTAPHVAVMSSL